mmetsp:Transcript_35430/g.101824  ORF Transcript_35430/g.101824 Transcript_35430/m.101824 type:complete len:195 (+) Transcript_35430:1279-1863(+)
MSAVPWVAHGVHVLLTHWWGRRCMRAACLPACTWTSDFTYDVRQTDCSGLLVGKGQVDRVRRLDHPPSASHPQSRPHRYHIHTQPGRTVAEQQKGDTPPTNQSINQSSTPDPTTNKKHLVHPSGKYERRYTLSHSSSVYLDVQVCMSAPISVLCVCRTPSSKMDTHIFTHEKNRLQVYTGPTQNTLPPPGTNKG